MNATYRHRIGWGVSALAVGALLLWSLWPSPRLVEVVEVLRKPLIVTLDEEGETRVRERFVVSAPVAGKLLRIELEPGDPVVAGETVLAVVQPRDPGLLDPRRRAEAEEEVLVLEAQAEMTAHQRDRARAELDFARRDCERARRLVVQEVLAEQRLDQAELGESQAIENLRASEHSLESATHRLARARARLLSFGDPLRRGDDPLSIRSPIDGVVLRRMRESEAAIMPGDALLEVGNPEDIEIVADYLSKDSVRVRTGARVLIERWGGDGTLEGRVRRVEPSGFTKISALGVEEKRVNVIVELITARANRPGLADGFRVETRIVVSDCENAVQVPIGSLFRRGDDWAVFVVESGRARLRNIEIGSRAQTAVEVSGGLEVGEQVIVHPGDKVADGVRVAARAPVY